MFSDEVIGLSIANRRSMAAAHSQGQALVDELDRDIITLRAKLARARLDLETERGRRIVAEARIEELLDMEV